MVQNNLLKTAALWLSYLIILLPIHASVVFASITNVEAKGQAGIQNYVRGDDFINFKVTASISGDADISPTQVRLYPNPIQFQSCNPGLNGFDCTLRYPSTGVLSFGPGQVPYTIKLYEDDGTEESSYASNVTVDNIAPQVDFTVGPNTNGQMNFLYTVTDYAYTVGDPSACSGVGKVEFYHSTASTSSTLFDTKQHTTSDCIANGTVQLSPQIDSGTLTICGKAFDRFNQNTTLCKNFEIDKINPSITSVQVADASGLPINYIATTPINAILIVNITEQNLNEQMVRANLSALTNSIADSDRAADSCSSAEGTVGTTAGVNTCSWSFSLAPVPTEKTLQIMVTAVDDSGNSDTEVVSKLLGVDTTGPVVESLKTLGADLSPTNYLKNNDNVFVAAITEDKAGLNPQQVILHMDSSSYPATFCKEGEEGWVCYWGDIDIPTKIHSPKAYDSIAVYLDTDSRDRAGNAFVLRFDARFTLDIYKPEVTSVTVKAIAREQPLEKDYVVLGDSLKITALVKDNAGLGIAFADLSAVIRNATFVEPDNCADAGNKTWQCTWVTEPVNKPGYIEGNLRFYFTDIIGNTLLYNKSITVYEEAELPGDFFHHTLECSPTKIDRQTTTLINHKVYCHVNLTSNPAELLQVALDSCDGEDKDKVANAEIFNVAANTSNPFIVLTLAADPMKIDQLDLNCTLSIFFRSDKKVSKFPEKETVNIAIPFYNMPLGELGAEVNKKIEDAKDFSFLIGDWVGVMNKILNFGERLCRLFGTFVKIYGVLQIIGLDLGLTATTTAPTGLGQIADNMRQGVQTANSGLQVLGKQSWAQIIQKFCKFFSCRLFYDEIWGGLKPIGDWQRGVLKTFNSVATFGTDKVPIFTGIKAYDYRVDEDTIDGRVDFGIHLTGKLNPKDSLVVSTLTLCVPGIIYNLNKLRQIECLYVDCLETNARNGLPLKACEDAKHYAQCKYVVGEMFQLAPLTGLWNALLNNIKTALSSPWGFIDLTLGIVCEFIIKVPYAGKEGYVCLVNDIAGLVADLYQDLSGIGKGWKIENDYCKRID